MRLACILMMFSFSFNSFSLRLSFFFNNFNLPLELIFSFDQFSFLVLPNLVVFISISFHCYIHFGFFHSKFVPHKIVVILSQITNCFPFQLFGEKSPDKLLSTIRPNQHHLVQPLAVVIRTLTALMGGYMFFTTLLLSVTFSKYFTHKFRSSGSSSSSSSGRAVVVDDTADSVGTNGLEWAPFRGRSSRSSPASLTAAAAATQPATLLESGSTWSQPTASKLKDRTSLFVSGSLLIRVSSLSSTSILASFPLFAAALLNSACHLWVCELTWIWFILAHLACAKKVAKKASVSSAGGIVTQWEWHTHHLASTFFNIKATRQE